MKNAFSPFIFKNGLTIKNKFVLAPMTTYSSNIDLTLSDEEELYYNSRAKEFGMVITAATAVNKNAQAFDRQISVRDERYLESMKRLANCIKKENSAAILQIHHGGRMNQPGLYHNQDIVAPSSIKAERENTVTPRELKTSEVYDIIDDFVNASRIALKAGFDGVEIHGANTYLVQQFFSPNSNLRNDEFGGSVIKRMTFAVQIIQRIKKLRLEMNKPNFVIGYRLSPEEIEIPGISLDDTMTLVSTLKSLRIDYIHLSLNSYKQSSLREKKDNTPIVRMIKNIVKNEIPIIGVGSIESNETAEDAFNHGYTLLALGKIALSDPFVVSNLEKNIQPSKRISDKSLLPTPLIKRLKSWIDGYNGYYFN